MLIKFCSSTSVTQSCVVKIEVKTGPCNNRNRSECSIFHRVTVITVESQAGYQVSYFKPQLMLTSLWHPGYHANEAKMMP